ncbi:trypsin alpha-4-like [Periplaneta americana]|uniref:trypsin alpha-4-like n=1 Tax=Periplaneta americana TaxID=6978 RepID=UPI0037E7044F
MWVIYILVISASGFPCNGLRSYKRPLHLANRPIVGGESTQINNFPHQVSLGYYSGDDEDTGNKTTSHFCGGSIISLDWVLTAAHCMTPWSGPHDFLVRVGSSIRDQGGYLHEVSHYIIHADYVPRKHDPDLALVKVMKPFHIGPTVNIIPLNNSPLLQGKIATVSGWGTTTEGGESPLQLQKVQIPIMPTWECKLIYRTMITENMFCAGRAGRSACHGDSGGAVLFNGNQIGVVSWGRSCELAGYSGVYVNVYQLRKWIHKHAGV